MFATTYDYGAEVLRIKSGRHGEILAWKISIVYVSTSTAVLGFKETAVAKGTPSPGGWYNTLHQFFRP